MLDKCRQYRTKTCQISSQCNNRMLKMERPCGVCTTLDSVTSLESVPETNDSTSAFFSIRQNDMGAMTMLRYYCLSSDHYSPWSEWSECLSACKKVRFRHCLSVECRQRVPYRDDPAVMEEQWCVPEQAGDINCEQFLINNILQVEPMMEPSKCERMLKQMAREKTKMASKNQKNTEGSSDEKGESLSAVRFVLKYE